MLWPSTVTLPSVGTNMPQMMPMSVVLPAPLGPSSAKISPRRISRLMSLRATSPEAYVLNSFEIEMMGCMGMRTFVRKSLGGDWMRGGSGLLDGRAASRQQMLMTVNRVRAGNRKCSFHAVPDGSVHARGAYRVYVPFGRTRQSSRRRDGASVAVSSGANRYANTNRRGIIVSPGDG